MPKLLHKLSAIYVCHIYNLGIYGPQWGRQMISFWFPKIFSTKIGSKNVGKMDFYSKRHGAGFLPFPERARLRSHFKSL